MAVDKASEIEVHGWESSRAGEPVDFPAIVFQKLAVLLNSSLGSRDRHRHLQDMDSLLAHFHDTFYFSDLTQASNVRKGLIKDGLKDGVLTMIERKEAVDTHQRMWLSALIRMMKRHGLLGETWIRG
jgi:hypothetical protein